MKSFLVMLVILCGTICNADINKLISALKFVESSNNPTAYRSDTGASGILQIRKCVIDDVNRIYKTKFVHSDAFIVSKAEVIFTLYISYYAGYYKKMTGKVATLEIMSRQWHGGPRGWDSKYKGIYKNTTKYWNSVKIVMKKQSKCNIA